MKNINYLFLLLLLTCVACDNKEESRFVNDKNPRVALYPEPETFNADGTTASGAESFVSVVTVAEGSSTKSDLKWSAELSSPADWASVKTTAVTSSFKDEFSGKIYESEEKGIEIKLSANSGWKRSFTVNVKLSDGTVAPFEFTQLGSKADADVTSDVKGIEFLAEGGSQDIAFVTNMGDVYSFGAKYEEGSSSWLTWTSSASGLVTLKASEWSDTETGRSADFYIIVGTAATSIDTLTIPVVQLANDTYYYMYGPSCDGLSIDKSLQMTKLNLGIYSADSYFRVSSGGKNPVLFNLNSRELTYPCYALSADGSVVELASASASVPSGPAIDVDGMRTLVVNFNDKTWTWSRISTQNCMPDEEVANYKKKSFTARDGSVKEWMVEFIRWDGGSSTKLGSLMVPTATGAGSAGTGGYAAASFPTSWNDPTMNPAFETTEIGGSLTGTSENGRLYTFDEMMTGNPRFGIGYARYETLPEGWLEGSEFKDAVGNDIKVEYLNTKTDTPFSGDNSADEKAHPMLTMQAQGICPYGWHVANASDWIDLAYAACKASEGRTYPLQEDQVTYKQFSDNSGKGAVGDATSERGIGNFGAWLRNSAYWGGGNISDGADAFGFNYYPLGFRYMTQGYQCAGTRNQTWIPLCFSSAAAFRVNVLINNTVTYAEMANIDNGQAIMPFRCVKNYK